MARPKRWTRCAAHPSYPAAGAPLLPWETVAPTAPAPEPPTQAAPALAPAPAPEPAATRQQPEPRPEEPQLAGRVRIPKSWQRKLGADAYAYVQEYFDEVWRDDHDPDEAAAENLHS